MKKMWKMRKDSKAVSPVIATILMVAITVVLAAVLYVMVMGFGGPSTQTPTGSFTAATSVASGSEKVQFGVITPDTQFTACKYIIASGASSDTYTCTAAATLTPPATKTLTGVTLTATDLAVDGKISSGDYLSATGLTAGTSYTVTLLFTATGASIASITFTAA